MLWLGRREAVFRRALTRARAGTAGLPYLQHLLEVTFRAWRLSSLQRLTCCNAPSEFVWTRIEGWGCGCLCCGVECGVWS